MAAGRFAATTVRFAIVAGGAIARPRLATRLARVGATVARGNTRAFASAVRFTAIADDATGRPEANAVADVAIIAFGTRRFA